MTTIDDDIKYERCVISIISFCTRIKTDVTWNLKECHKPNNTAFSQMINSIFWLRQLLFFLIYTKKIPHIFDTNQQISKKNLKTYLLKLVLNPKACDLASGEKSFAKKFRTLIKILFDLSKIFDDAKSLFAGLVTSENSSSIIEKYADKILDFLLKRLYSYLKSDYSYNQKFHQAMFIQPADVTFLIYPNYEQAILDYPRCIGLFRKIIERGSEIERTTCQRIDEKIIKHTIAHFYDHISIRDLPSLSLERYYLITNFWFIINHNLEAAGLYILNKESTRDLVEDKVVQSLDVSLQETICRIMNSKKRYLNILEIQIQFLFRNKNFLENVINNPEILNDIDTWLKPEVFKTVLLYKAKLIILAILCIVSLSAPAFGILFLEANLGFCLSTIPIVAISILVITIIKFIKKTKILKEINRDGMNFRDFLKIDSNYTQTPNLLDTI